MRPVEFTVKQAALACDVSESTIRRRLPAFPNARRETDDAGAWIIPVGDLLGEGFTVAVTDEADGADEVRGTARDDHALAELTREVGLLTSEVDELERTNSVLEQRNRELIRRVEAAEALVAEQQQSIDELDADLAGARKSSGPSVSRSERAQRLDAARRALDEIRRPDSS